MWPPCDNLAPASINFSRDRLQLRSQPSKDKLFRWWLKGGFWFQHHISLCYFYMLGNIVHGVCKSRYSTSICRSLAFGHRLRVHLQGLFTVNTAGVCCSRGRDKSTWKPHRPTDTPMQAAASQRKGQWASHVEIRAFKCMLCVSIIVMCSAACQCVFVCLSEWCVCRGAGAPSEGVSRARTQPQTPCGFPLSGSGWMWRDAPAASSFVLEWQNF